MKPEEKLTPKKIVESNKCYTIPIYQRLFEWNRDNIETLLSDLENGYKDKVDYYIGILTSNKNNELIDGQQRFVVMMLLGCVFQRYFPSWKKFILKKGESISRLSFPSRKKDSDYLKAIIMGKSKDYKDIVNQKMKEGINTIEEFIKGIEKRKGKDVIDIKSFAEYVYEHLSFFISELPSEYNASDLNEYFERMNTTGKNLEQQDILKVKLLRHLRKDRDKYMCLWNRLSDVDELLIRKKWKEKESSFRSRKKTALSEGLECILETISAESEENRDSVKTIIDGIKSNQPVSEPELEEDDDDFEESESRSLLKFPQILLQALFRYTKKNGYDIKNIDEFFKTSNLLDTFSKYLPYEDNNVNPRAIRCFMETLVKCRLVLDIFFVRMTDKGYSLDMNFQKDENSFDKEKLKMFESMLYVSSSDVTNYRWFGWLMDYVEKADGNWSSKGLYQHLKDEDNKLHRKNKDKDKDIFSPNKEDFSYDNIDRYWFWRLDYYLWENWESYTKNKKYKDAVKNYVFRQNRSIEHFHPQNQNEQTDKKWDKVNTDSFGNLAMISSSFNSEQSNDYMKRKFARIEEQIDKNSLQSIKLLCMYIKAKEGKNEWTEEKAMEHEKEMFEVLKKSFSENIESFDD